MNCEIIAVGNEILMGNTVNTNAAYISEKLFELGIDTIYSTVVGDTSNRIKEVLGLALSRVDIIVITGGLGPTQDDLTKETVAEMLNKQLIIDKKSKENIELFFKKINREPTNSNFKQAYLPEDSMVLYNKKGTAPGCIIEHEHKTIVLLPGPPHEMKSMFDDVYIYLEKKSGRSITTKYVKVFGLGESKVEEKILNLINNDKGVYIGTYAKYAETMLAITAKSDSYEKNESVLKEFIEEINSLVGDHIYSYEDESFENAVCKKLIANNISISFAESCTGGMISSAVTDIPGVSKIFKGSVVSYSNESKINILGVSKNTLEKYGAVSEETAMEMVNGIKNITKSNIAVSVTGIAGPDGATKEKPVGLVYIGFIYNDKKECYKFNFSGDRSRIRLVTKQNVLNIIFKNIN